MELVSITRVLVVRYHSGKNGGVGDTMAVEMIAIGIECGLCLANPEEQTPGQNLVFCPGRALLSTGSQHRYTNNGQPTEFSEMATATYELDI
ncbi:hypothetical protein GQX73_g9401 [Xylaria multiplex]|uniref:Uncharacterized protein n=1 Tax=Xylaria multiplex TaxID=323545 RepID=A0A7C8IUJ5_9PEZI|nr:hypothetical protein GQX73_g9401 [Xylaria multiplex]